MKKSYILVTFLVLIFLFSNTGEAQSKTNSTPSQKDIPGLSIYPNPAPRGKLYVYITSDFRSTKKIEFFNVLGKRLFSTNLVGKQLNISNLSTGVYILKITENAITETRKLIIK